MKKITILVLLFLNIAFSYGQYYYIPHISAGQNPGGLNNDGEYPVGSGLPADWTLVQGPGSSAAWSAQATLPFPFTFNGNVVNNYFVSNSGVLTFASSVGVAPSFTNTAIPSSSIPDNSLCVWGVQGIGSNDNIVSKVFGTAPNRQFWILFSSYTGDNTSSWQYWSFVLEESTNKIYIVDQRFSGTASTLTVGIQINSTTAFQVAGSPSLACLAGANATPADNTYYEFIPGTLPTHDIWMKSLNIYPIAPIATAPFTVTGLLTNLGSETVNSMNINYNINGGSPLTFNVTGLSLNTYANYTYTHPQSWTPAAIGLYTLKVWASNINGNPDQNNANDTVTLLVNVVNQIVQRLPMHESFTSSTCAPCVAGNQNLATQFAANPGKWVCLKYQMSWPGNGDPYYTAEGGDRRTFYGVNSVPQLWVDGGLGINTSSYTSAQLNARYNVPSFVNLSANYTISGNTVDMNININPVADIQSNNLKMQVAIFEYTTHNNTGTNGETEFKYVMKKMVPDAMGTSLAPLVAGTNVTQSLTYTFQGIYRLPPNALSPINNAIENSVEEFGDLGVVVWLQDQTTKEIFQSCYATILVGTTEIGNPDGIISIFPNPAKTEVNVHYFLAEEASVSVDIYSMMGQKVSSVENIRTASGSHYQVFDTQNLTNGIYIMNLNLGGKRYTSKLNISK